MESSFQYFDKVSDERYMFIRNNIELYNIYKNLNLDEKHTFEKHTFEKQHGDFIETLLHHDTMKNNAYEQYKQYSVCD